MRGGETNFLKRRGVGKLGKGEGCLKRGAGTPLRTMVGTEKSAEAFIQKCSVNKAFGKNV